MLMQANIHKNLNYKKSENTIEDYLLGCLIAVTSDI